MTLNGDAKLPEAATPEGRVNGITKDTNGAPTAATNDFTTTNGSPSPPAYQSHPLGPLSRGEIAQSSGLIRAYWPAGTECHFKVITLLEPAKAQLIPYLAAERAGQSPVDIDRRAFVVYYFKGTHNLHEAVVNLTQNKVESNVKLGPFIHANGDGEELVAVEKALLAHPDVQAEIAKLKLPDGAEVVADPWIYGSDGVKDGKFYDDKRVMQCFLYMRDPQNSSEADSCHYAFPLPISPVVDPATLELIRIDIMPTGLDEKVKAVQPWQPVPPSEYIPEAQPQLRTDLKPLRVVQPEGASFAVENFSEMGKLLRWQKWNFKVGFNQREGMVLYDVHYDNKPLFYRLSLSDMSIPYADPRHPFHRKAAFDLGDAGAGIMANNLQLGCDCLGSIYYISGVLSGSDGQPVDMPNVICVHEQDAGIGWKHTNYRTNRAVVVRQRELVLQTILTVSNYEYILSFIFNTAGDVTYEARATGILSTQPLDLDLTTTPHPYGTVVHPGVLAGFHQHFFSLRIDPMIAGHGNSIICDEAVPLPRDAKLNPHGVGFTVKHTEIDTSGGYDLDASRNRVYRILNPAVRNPVNGAAVGYKVMVPPMQTILADTDSFHYKRAEFADRSIYVTKYAEGELYAGGLYTNQSRGGTGVRSWADRKDTLRAGDPVMWVQFGINHIPRVEDFPVMPVETLRVMLRPVNFFDKNPALDVPPSTQAVNCSVALNRDEEVAGKMQGLSVGGVNGKLAECCGTHGG
ncbi:copper amine oxidase 1 [Diplogelasinospora grovesii]|uniref:Amine oxidase n=1 Tax=Diplogelasinospora grovesii TaxID=303347 RepID=A0AAN6S283_9PEZI|nr:copper amine oxidase 1 [Diplogelasinospora grovesii]